MAPRADLRGPGDGSQDPEDVLDSDAATPEQHLKELVEEAARAPRPTPAERQNLLAAAAEGDGPAADRLLRAGLEMVIRQAATRTGRGLAVDELVQEGSLGLLSAIRGYSGSGRDDFDLYAEEKVTSAIEAALAEEEEAKQESRRLVGDAEAFERAELIVARDLGRRPTDLEVGEKLEWEPGRALAMGEIVREARAKHDQELLGYLDPDRLDLDSIIDIADRDVKPEDDD